MIKISSVDICPYCNQGRIVKVNTKKSNEIIYICEECDTVWGNYDDIFTKKGIGFYEYAKERGFEPLWSEIEGWEWLINE